MMVLRANLTQNATFTLTYQQSRALLPDDWGSHKDSGKAVSKAISKERPFCLTNSTLGKTQAWY